MDRIQAVIFDMDGVLIDSEPLHFEALNRVLGLEGHHVTPEENEQFLGWTTERMLRVLGERFDLRHRQEHYLTSYEEAFLEMLREPVEAAPGALDLLDELRRMDVPVAVASSSRRSWIQATLGALGMADRFTVVASGDEVTRSKPDPEIFLLAARRLGVPPGACAVIEDSPNGVMAGRRAGMRVIGVRTPYTAHLALEGADIVVESLAYVDASVLGVR